MSKERSDTVIELSKSFIGCASAITVACVGGVFTLVAVIAPRLPILGSETRTAPPLSPTVLVVTATPAPTVTRMNTGVFGPVIFAPGITGINANTAPLDAAVRFPEGVTQVFATFSFDAMMKGSPWRYEWYYNGFPQENLKWSGNWVLAERGSTWLNTWKPDGIDSGAWEVRLYIMDQLVQKGSFTIEKRQVGAPFFAVIRFAEGVEDDKPLNPHKPYDTVANKPDSFKAGTKEVYAFFDVGNMTKGLKWRREWYRDGQLLSGLVTTDVWDANQTEKDWWVKTFNDNGLASGSYELKLYIEDKLVQLGTFVIE